MRDRFSIVFRTVVGEFTMELPPTGLRNKSSWQKRADPLNKCSNLPKNCAYCFKISIRKTWCIS